MLGVAPGADATALRAAFHTALRAHHPDTTAVPDGAGERTATVVEAYRLLRDRAASDADPAWEPAERPGPADASPPALDDLAVVEVIGAEALWVGVDARAVAGALVDVADELGDVSYVDRSSGLLQLTVRPDGGPTCWFTLSTHARPGGAVVVATLESIEAAPTPPADELLLALAEALADRLGAWG